ncbi:hypothetical protein [uncultured Alistipes sp.]|jgi:hypothetical protein|uniref:hypothetical protein n=1 Tax=uncultured Alistipes sp. TaxID=538949 RepID=UPI0025ED7AB2|nr:hypothetical protein [uncultured Alistipes sp.]
MERYQGIILVRLQNVGSKSEGRYAYLVRDDDMSAVKLCREEQPPFNDLFFEQFDKKEVSVTGRLSHGWLIVEAVEIINGETDQNTQQ